VVVNLSDESLAISGTPINSMHADLILANYPDAAAHTGLRPWEARVFAASRH
jgi:hypothetical protein